jgi:phenylpyruvate tautomerase PptA (4-oxalocrotonate tautomerase family)
MIEVYAPSDLLPAGSAREIGEQLTGAVLRAEGVSAPGPFSFEQHGGIRPSDRFHRRADSGGCHRTSHSSSSDHAARCTQQGRQKQLVMEATKVLTEICGDASHATRILVLLTEAAEGGWGIAGTAFGREEFAALTAKGAKASSAPVDP